MHLAAVATASGPMVACLGSLSPWRVLSQDEARTLEAICGRIIPADEDPGAVDAGAVTFIDRQLAGAYRKHRKIYRLGLEGINQTSLAQLGKSFAALASTQQDLILQTLDSGQERGAQWKQVSAKSFFDMVLSHTMQGFYGDPRHGGNCERASWKMLGLDYPQVRGRGASG